MSDIIDLATQLGKAIASSSEAARLRDARKALEAETDTLRTLQDYHKQSDKVAELESQNKPVEIADKHRLQELHDKLVSQSTFKKFTAAQVDYIDLMRRVNDTLRRQLGEIEADAQA